MERWQYMAEIRSATTTLTLIAVFLWMLAVQAGAQGFSVPVDRDYTIDLYLGHALGSSRITVSPLPAPSFE